jgi:hypothetical protein
MCPASTTAPIAKTNFPLNHAYAQAVTPLLSNPAALTNMVSVPTGFVLVAESALEKPKSLKGCDIRAGVK